MTHFARIAAVFVLTVVFSVPVAFAQESDDNLLDIQGGLQKTTIQCQIGGSESMRCPRDHSCVDPDETGPGSGFCYGPPGLVNLLKVDSLKDLLELVLSLVVQVGSILLVLSLVWTGFQFVAAQGNEEKIRSARDGLMWTVIGGLLLLGAQALALVIKATVESL